MEFLDLNKGWVVQVSKEGKSLIDGFSGSIEFRDKCFEFIMLLSSNEGGLIKVLSVFGLILLEGSKLVL